jgi:hypothetical protein
MILISVFAIIIGIVLFTFGVIERMPERRKEMKKEMFKFVVADREVIIYGYNYTHARGLVQEMFPGRRIK